MLKKIKAWIIWFRIQRIEDSYKRGYEEGMRLLKNQIFTPEQAYAIADSAFEQTESANAFDRGMKQAIYDYELGAVE